MKSSFVLSIWTRPGPSVVSGSIKHSYLPAQPISGDLCRQSLLFSHWMCRTCGLDFCTACQTRCKAVRLLSRVIPIGVFEPDCVHSNLVRAISHTVWWS